MPDQATATLAFKGQRVIRAQRRDGVPRFGGRDKRQRAVVADLSGKIAGTP